MAANPSPSSADSPARHAAFGETFTIARRLLLAPLVVRPCTDASSTKVQVDQNWAMTAERRCGVVVYHMALQFRQQAVRNERIVKLRRTAVALIEMPIRLYM